MDAVASLGKIAIFGAAGAVGHAIAPALEADGSAYRVVGRDLERLQREFPRAEAVTADFLKGTNVDEAAKGIDTVIYLAGAPYTNFEQHPIMASNALRAAREQGVQRFVHVAPVYSYGPATSLPVAESAPHRPSTRKGRFRLEQERLVLEADGNTLRTLVLHLPDFYGPYADNSLANYFINEAVAGKAATFIGRLNAPREFAFVPDAAAPLLRLASSAGSYGACWNLAGYSTITGAEFAALVFKQLQRPPRVRVVSKAMLRIAGLFDPMMREFVEMYYLYSSGFVLDDSKIRKALGQVDKTPYAEGVRRTIESSSAKPTAM